MSLFLFAHPSDCKTALRVYQGSGLNFGSDPKSNIYEGSGTGSGAADGQITTDQNYAVNQLVGYWFIDIDAKIFRVNSNTVGPNSVLKLSVCLSDGSTVRPSNGAYTVHELGAFMDKAHGRIQTALSRAYVFPLAGTDDKTVQNLKDWVINITLYRLWAFINPASSPNNAGIPEVISRLYKATLEEISSVKAGEDVLLGETRRELAAAALASPGSISAEWLFPDLPGHDDVEVNEEEAQPRV